MTILELILSVEAIIFIMGFFVFLFTAVLATVDQDRNMAIMSIKALIIPVTWPYYLIRGIKRYGDILWNR